MPAFKKMVRTSTDEELFEILLKPFLYNKEHYKAALIESKSRDLISKDEAKEILGGNTLIIKNKIEDYQKKEISADNSQTIRRVSVYPGKSLIKKGFFVLVGGCGLLLLLHFYYQSRSSYILFYPYLRFIVSYGMIGVGFVMLLIGFYRNLFRK